MADNSIKTGSIRGAAIAVGPHASASVTLQGSKTQEELRDLLWQLRTEIQNSEIPDGAKRVLLRGPVVEMEEAVQTAKPEGLANAIKIVNDTIESVDGTADKVSGVADKLRKIASTAGVAYNSVAPFLASLFG